MIPNATQAQTTTSSLIAGLAGYAAAKGWLGLDTGAWTALIVAGIAAWPAIVTRVQALKNTVGKSGAIVVTNSASANALPNNPNVVAASEVTQATLTKAQ